MAIVPLRLRSVLAPLPVCKRTVPFHHATYFCRNKPPLFPNYDRAHTLAIVTLDYYRSYCKKRATLAKLRERQTVSHTVRSQHQPPRQQRKMFNPNVKALTPSLTVSRGPTGTFQNSKGSVLRPSNVPPSSQTSTSTASKAKASSFLGGLLHKARVGPNKLIVEQNATNSNAPIAKKCGRNGTECWSYTKMQIVTKGGSGGRTAVAQHGKCSTEMRHGKLPASSGNNQSSQPTVQASSSGSGSDTTRHQRSPPVRGKPCSPPTSPPVPRRKQQAPIRPDVRLPSPDVRQEPNLNPTKWQRQIRRSEKRNHQPEYAVKPKPQFPMAIIPRAAQHVNNVVPTEEVKNPVINAGTKRKKMTPSSPKAKRPKKRNVVIGNRPVQGISASTASGGREKCERTYVFKDPTVSHPVPKVVSNGRELAYNSKTLPKDIHRHDRKVQEAREYHKNHAKHHSGEKFAPRMLHSVPGSNSSPDNAVAIEPKRHSSSETVSVAVAAVAAHPRQNAIQKTCIPEHVEMDESVDASKVVQEVTLPKKSFARPIKNRRLENVTTEPKPCLTYATYATSVRRPGIDDIDLTKLKKSRKTQHSQSRKATESPVCITEAPFAADDFSLRRVTTLLKRPRRCLSFERNPQRVSKNLCCIADPQEECQIRSACEAVQLTPLESAEKSSVGGRRQQTHLANSDAWEITFVEQFTDYLP